MSNYAKLDENQITNQCAILCNLRSYVDEESPCWIVLKGTQDEIGKEIALRLETAEISRIDDFGGVCKTFLCDGEEYKSNPPRTKPGAAIFSFTPKKRAISEGHDMANVATKSGFSLMILTLQKHDKFGKVWVLDAVIKNSHNRNYVYYEDTNTVVDEIKDSVGSANVTAVHVMAPGFEEFVSLKADRVITQQAYQAEVLLAQL